MRKINRLLVANRGEIALRVMRTARQMGITCIAVYSDADVNARHVRFADEAYRLGPAPSKESYLLGDKVLELCKEHHIDAIHPGYGFLSENSDFARKVQEAGLIFIGPSPESMDLMGGKISAKQAAKRFNVPLVPGLDHAITDIPAAKREAESIGFPVLIKASAGGGGKGMRVVENTEEFEEQMERAVSEAINSFGDGSCFIEKYVSKPRHVEIQILADQHGNAVYLFERECSIQRRHQKVVEEAPSSVLTPEMRQAMGEAAIRVVKACNYYNAGTVEFLLDADLNFYFLEMNTRLQVEHPVTELITGLDLVREQILIAEGHPLSFTQDDLQINGHAMEIRVCAEDPFNNFLPNLGKLQVYRRPTGDGVRVDDYVEEGMEVPIHYDSMIGKLIVHGTDRNDAIARLIRAIDNYTIVGFETTLGFCRFVLEHEAFVSGHFDTGFIPNYFTIDKLLRPLEPEEEAAAIMVADQMLLEAAKEEIRPLPRRPLNPWRVNRLI